MLAIVDPGLATKNKGFGFFPDRYPQDSRYGNFSITSPYHVMDGPYPPLSNYIKPTGGDLPMILSRDVEYNDLFKAETDSDIRDYLQRKSFFRSMVPLGPAMPAGPALTGANVKASAADSSSQTENNFPPVNIVQGGPQTQKSYSSATRSFHSVQALSPTESSSSFEDSTSPTESAESLKEQGMISKFVGKTAKAGARATANLVGTVLRAAAAEAARTAMVQVFAGTFNPFNVWENYVSRIISISAAELGARNLFPEYVAEPLINTGRNIIEAFMKAQHEMNIGLEHGRQTGSDILSQQVIGNPGASALLPTLGMIRTQLVNALPDVSSANLNSIVQVAQTVLQAMTATNAHDRAIAFSRFSRDLPGSSLRRQSRQNYHI